MATDLQTRNNITSLLAELPPENLRLVEQFVHFLREQARQGYTVVTAPAKKKRQLYLYPTVAVPARSLDGLIGIMPPVGGNALKDSEALYDGK
ncbi:MAG: hypothetical protein QMD04_13515 [Anaerolineales bacterium]|nr:hypothetical protein [Anaerolineales bacterium]